VVTKTCAHLSMGLSQVVGLQAGCNPDDVSEQAAHLIEKIPLARIFRVGYGLCLGLKWRAQRWRKKSWSVSQKLPLSFWDEQWMGVLGGLLLKRPLFFDNYATGRLYREFESQEDIRKTERALKAIVAIDDILGRMNLHVPALSTDIMLTYKNLLMTLWARHVLGLSAGLKPLDMDQLKSFFDRLWSGGYDASQKPFTIASDVRKSCLRWLAAAGGQPPDAIYQTVGPSLDNLLDELESEYGEISPQDLRAQYIRLFLVEDEV
jgi:hypothetical protein